MQVQIKRQLKIELDQADITAAVKQFLADAGHHISDEDLAKINYVKSPQTGLRAELSISDEVVAADEVVIPTSGATASITETKVSVCDTASSVEEAVDQLHAQSEPAGEVATSTVEDVSPETQPVEAEVDQAVNDAIERAVAEVPAADEEDVPTVGAAPDLAARNALFK